LDKVEISSIQDDLDFIYNSSIFELNPTFPDNALEIIDKYHKGGDLTITTGDEYFGERDNLYKVIDFCKSKSYKIKILTSSLKKIKYGVNPLVNFLCWSRNISTDHSEIDNKIIRYFDKSYYNDDITKTIKFNLIWRLSTHSRNELISGISNTNVNDNLDYQIEYHRNDPKYGNVITSKLRPWRELIEIYNKSLLSFVVETEYWHGCQIQVDKEFKSTEIIPFTEKLIIPFLSKSMPILFGGDNYIKSIEELGLFVFNEEFGITDTTTESYNKAIKNLKSKSFEEINSIYQKNIEKIESNYKLISNILFSPLPYIINKIDTNPEWPLQLKQNQR
tara:strand:+ start:79 stop:1080 length:1002 start_codon:yes stop_codon:yes gene_type:complete